ncbi:MAG: hypothetical protein FJ087_05860 [Deltaproteobacteria bacterium]|nr:hypothetical protein [Deltaproteobacteria bacterium]
MRRFPLVIAIAALCGSPGCPEGEAIPGFRTGDALPHDDEDLGPEAGGDALHGDIEDRDVEGESSLPEGVAPDTAVPPDGPEPDAAVVPDATKPDAAPTDTPVVPDTATPETAQPDAATTETAQPDTIAPPDPGSCTPACDGRQCGPDGCGGQCGTCKPGRTCTEAGACVCTPHAMSACCSLGRCWFDGCGQVESAIEPCPYGCADDKCKTQCLPSCSGKQCGPDGCGGQCGTCKPGRTCTAAGACVCTPHVMSACCSLGRCWFDGCGQVESAIEPCPYGCADDKCKPPCTPSCGGKQCGPDGCGGQCGACTGGKTCSAAGQCVGCTPDCANRECGGDGCGGGCGTCPTGETCTAGQCIDPGTCTGLPQSWGPIGATATMSIPGTAAVYQARCFDYTGDGKGDNGLASLASLGGMGFDINALIQQGIDSGTLSMLFDFDGVKDFVNAPAFPLSGLRGRPSGGTWLLDPDSYDGNCTPLIGFQNATIKSKALAAGPGFFILVMPLGGGTMSFALDRARMSGTVTSGGAAGVALASGVIGGLLSQDALDAALSGAQGQCDGPNQPAFCQYLDFVPMFLQMDIDTDNDGVADSMAVCFEVTLSPATVSGYF